MLKQRIRNWLEIKDPVAPTQPEKLNISEISDVIAKATEKRIELFINNLEAYQCYVCRKRLIRNRDPIYSNTDGYKFCSHSCIDKNKKGK